MAARRRRGRARRHSGGRLAPAEGDQDCTGCRSGGARACRRRQAGGSEGRERILRIRRPHQGHRQGRTARPHRGLPREAALPRGPVRQGRRPALPDREGPVRGAGRAGQGQPRLGRGRIGERQAPIRPATRPFQEAVQPAVRGRPGSRRSGHRRRQDHASQGCPSPGRGQSRLHRHPLADRRPHRANRLHGRQPGQSGERHPGHHRPPGSDLCPVPDQRARPRDDPRGATQGRRRTEQDRDPGPAGQRPGISSAPAPGTSPTRRSISRPIR